MISDLKMQPEMESKTDTKVSADTRVDSDILDDIGEPADPEMDYLVDEDEDEFLGDIDRLSWSYQGGEVVSGVLWVVVYDGQKHRVFINEQSVRNRSRESKEGLRVFAEIFARVLEEKGLTSFDDVLALKGLGRKLSQLWGSKRNKGLTARLFLFVWRDGNAIKSRYVPDVLIKGGSGHPSKEWEAFLAEVVSKWLEQKIKNASKVRDFRLQKKYFKRNIRSFTSWLIGEGFVPNVAISKLGDEFWTSVLGSLLRRLEEGGGI